MISFLKKMFIIVVIIIIFPFTLVTAENADENSLISCFDNYIFGNVDLSSITPDKPSYGSGEVIKFKGLVKNYNSYPIVNGAIFARLLHLNSNEDPFKNGDNTIDEFWIKENINILADGSYPLELNYKIPIFAPSGRYQLATYFVVARKFNLTGLSFLSNMFGGLTEFDITNNQNLDYFIDRNSITINNQEFMFRDFHPIFSKGDDIQINFQIKNISNINAQGKVIFQLYKWDSLLKTNLISEFQEQIIIAAQTSQHMSRLFSHLSSGVYLLKIISDINYQKTIADVRFVIEGQDARINYTALTKFPINQNETVKYFTCFHTSTTFEDITDGIVTTSIYNNQNQELTKHTYQGKIYPDVLSFQQNYTFKDNYDFLKIRSTLTNKEGKVLDQADIIYDCSIDATIPNKLSFEVRNNRLSAQGINWCNYPIALLFDNILIRSLRDKEIAFVQNHIHSKDISNIKLPQGQYEIVLQSGQFLLNEEFALTDMTTNNQIINMLFALLIMIGIIISYLIFKKKFQTPDNIQNKSQFNTSIKILLFCLFTLPLFIYTIPTQAAVNKNEGMSCYIANRPETQIANKEIIFQAKGVLNQPVRQIKWSAPEGNPNTGIGNIFKTTFSEGGPKEVFFEFNNQRIDCKNVVIQDVETIDCDEVRKTNRFAPKIVGTCFLFGHFTEFINKSLRQRIPSSIGLATSRIATTINMPLKFLQNNKIISDGTLVSLNHPIYLADVDSAPIVRTIEKGGPTGSPEKSGPSGINEPIIGTSFSSEPKINVPVYGEWIIGGGADDSPPIIFSDKCFEKDFLPQLYTVNKRPVEFKYGPLLSIGICAKQVEVKTEGLKCSAERCLIEKEENKLTHNVKIDAIYDLKAVVIIDPDNKLGKREVLSSYKVRTKLSNEAKVRFNLPPSAKISTNIYRNNTIELLSKDSIDPDKQPKHLSFNWQLLEKPKGSKVNIIKGNRGTDILQPDFNGQYKIRLTASDGLDTSSDLINVNFNGVEISIQKEDAQSSISKDTTPSNQIPNQQQNIPAQNTSITQTQIESQLSVLCNQGNICKTILTPNAFSEIDYTINSNNNAENIFISFYNVPKGITLQHSPSFLKPGQKSGKIIVSTSPDIIPKNYQALIRFRQGNKFTEIPIDIQVVQQNFFFPVEVEVLPSLPQ